MLSTPYFASYNTGQTIIPVGTRAFHIEVVSGSAYFNGGLMLAGQELNWYAADAKLYLGAPISIGTTGIGSRVSVFYTS